MKCKLSLCFFFPYHQVSGVPVLFANIINYISSFENIKKIYVIDYKNGALNNLIKDSKIIERIYFKNNLKVKVPSDSILIMQSILPYMIRHELVINSKTKILFWNLHPENLIPNYIPIHFINNFIKSNYNLFKKFIDLIFKIRFLKINQFIDLCLRRNGLVFMDITNLYNTCYKLNFKMPNDLEYLPVPVKIIIDRKINVKRKNISFSWVGRVESFKYFILTYILKKLSSYSCENKIIIDFHLIGDGLKLNNLKSQNFNNNYFRFKTYGNMGYEDLNNFLKSNVDLVFAMGTSALDSSKLGIPTVLVDYSYKKIKNYKFRWIFDTEGYDLGHDINNNNYKGPSFKIDELIKLFIENKKELSIKSRDYVSKNHDIKLISKLFIKHASTSNLIFGEINQNIIKKSIFRILYYKLNNYYTGTT